MAGVMGTSTRTVVTGCPGAARVFRGSVLNASDSCRDEHFNICNRDIVHS